MNNNPLLDKFDDRLYRDKEDGDIAYFYALTLHLEYITKIVTAGVLACVGDDADRHRYSIEYKLVRSDSLGDWADALSDILIGPAAQFIYPEARPITRQLTERVGQGDWRYSAVKNLHEAAKFFEIDIQVGNKVALRQFFQIVANIRNRTRGHGSPTSEQCSCVCRFLMESINEVITGLELFRIPWAYLHRNYSGKYRVSPMLGNCTVFDYLKRSREVILSNGVFIYLTRPIHVALVFSDPDLRDVFLPNGNYKSGTFEVLSYITNVIERRDGSAWSTPPGRLPFSETEGLTALEQIGNTFANLPPKTTGEIPRNSLETQLQDELLKTDRHPIVSLTGQGGIGKTTIALSTIEKITKHDSPPYEVILWISARDIDLLDQGPKPVSPNVVRKKDIAQASVELLEPSERFDQDFQPEKYFETILSIGAAGSTLFVMDNFETLESPADVFNWIDTHLRPPNKALITTRFRDFVGDYPIEVGGMTDEEALNLIDKESKRLGIKFVLDTEYKNQVIHESEGHPYVIKILLGQVAKEQRKSKPKRILANADHVLTALFERTYENLSPGGQRIFLLLCSWRVFVPAVAVEAVALRPGTERFDVVNALQELRQYSLIEEVASNDENEFFVGVPLAAASYGRRKLEVSPFKIAVEEDRNLLMEFGAGKREEAYQGVLPRIDRLVRTVASRASENPKALEDFIPILEYLAFRVPKAYLRLADLIIEIYDTDYARDKAKSYLRRFLETADIEDKKNAWLRLADLCRSTKDVRGEIHAVSEIALLPTTSHEEIGILANRINSRVRELKSLGIEDPWSSEVKEFIQRVIREMEKHTDNLSATDCSRLAWLHLNVGNEGRAWDIVKTGVERDPENEHCQKLMLRLK